MGGESCQIDVSRPDDLPGSTKINGTADMNKRFLLLFASEVIFMGSGLPQLNRLDHKRCSNPVFASIDGAGCSDPERTRRIWLVRGSSVPTGCSE